MSILANIRSFFDHVGENFNHTFRSPGRLPRIHQNNEINNTRYPTGKWIQFINTKCAYTYSTLLMIMLKRARTKISIDKYELIFISLSSH